MQNFPPSWLQPKSFCRKVGSSIASARGNIPATKVQGKCPFQRESLITKVFCRKTPSESITLDFWGRWNMLNSTKVMYRDIR